MKEFVKKKAVIVKDRLGLPNYMTMFYMEPGTYNPEDVPEMFKIRNKIVPAILISQYHNTTMKSMGGGAGALHLATPVLSSATTFRSVPLYSWKAGNW